MSNPSNDSQYNFVFKGKDYAIEKIAIELPIDYIFQCQKTDYTCGPAVLTALGAIFGKAFQEEDIAKIMETCSKIGSCHEKIDKWMKQNLPYEYMSTEEYKGGLGIANIRNQFTHDGHYIMVLGRRYDTVRYWDPNRKHTVLTDIYDIDWCNHKGTLKNWHVIADSSKDYFDLVIQNKCGYKNF
ncbi:MAG: hypothetical protein GC137_02485 [Alphaproteobacteria bacterium]|nr:hypothetical protein [Alphaproteobacteria bacterium]